jgi:hypothetical protein
MSSPQCSNHGIFTTINGISGCVCDSSWNAGSDMYDQRLIFNANNNNNNILLARDCSVSTIAVIATWSIALVAITWRLINVLRALIPMIKKKSKGLPLALLTWDIICVCPCAIAACAMKLSDPANYVLGTDVGFTLVYILPMMATTLEYSIFQQMEMSMMIANKASLNPLKRDYAIKNISKFIHFQMVAIYWLGSCTATLVTLSLDKSLGPEASGELICLYVRNLSIIMGVIFMAGAFFLLRRIQQMEVEDEVPSSLINMPGFQNHSFKETKAAKVLDLLKYDIKKKFTQHMSLIVVYAIFCMPLLLPQQTFVVAFGSTLVIITMAPARVFMKTRAKALSQDQSPIRSSSITLAANSGGLRSPSFNLSNSSANNILSLLSSSSGTKSQRLPLMEGGINNNNNHQSLNPGNSKTSPTNKRISVVTGNVIGSVQQQQ